MKSTKSAKKQTNICQNSAEKWRNRNLDSREQKKIRNFDKKQKQESKSLPKTEKTIQKIDKFLISIQIPTPKIYQKSTKKQTNICQKSAEKWRNRNSDSRVAKAYG